MIPSQNRTIKQIFQDKVPGTEDRHLISPELIAYLKWLIYVAPYEDRSAVDHVQFYQKQVAYKPNPAYYKIWRSLLQLFKELDGWYKEHLPSKKRRSCGTASGSANVIVVDREFMNVDFFIDQGLLDYYSHAAGVALDDYSHAAGVALGR